MNQDTPLLNAYQRHVVNWTLDYTARHFEGKQFTVAELGAGGGEVAGEIIRRLSEKGLHFAYSAFDIDRQKLALRNTGAHCHFLDVQSDFKLNSKFDVILASELIEHIENPFHFIREIAGISKLGTSLLLTTPNTLSLGSRFWFFLTGGFEHFKRPYNERELKWGHINPINPLQLVYFLRKNGFEVLKMDGEETAFHWIALLPFTIPMFLVSLFEYVFRAGGKGQRKRNLHTLKLIFSPKVLFSRTLIVNAVRKQDLITTAAQHCSSDPRFEA